MRILLIYPYCLEERLHTEDAEVVPIGVYYVGAMLIENGYDVEILNWHDIRRTPEKIPAIIRKKHPDVIGFSILHANRWGGIEIARIAKEIFPAVAIVFGGIGATNLWRHLLTHFPQIDYIVMGEGEITFLELIRTLEKKNRKAPGKISGIAFRQDGRPVKTKARAPVADLDSLPNPADHFTYRHLILSRGCPGACTFCGSPRFWKRKVRFHSATYFVDQIERLHRKGVTFFYVSDDTFTLRKKRVIDICRQILHRQLRVTWAAISRVDTIDEVILEWMRKAGCIQISYGVESGSEKIRRLLGKPFTTDRIEAAFRRTARWGIMARAYFIYGCPGENWQSIQQTLDLLDTLKPLAAIFYILDIFPGTLLYDDYRKRTGSTDDVWLKRIEDIMYFETDPALSQEQILAFGEKLRTHFYKNLPRYAQAVKLVDRPEYYPLHADFLSRLAMTFDHGDYAHIAAIPDKAQTAEKLYRKALDYHPDASAYLGLGIMAQKRGDYDGSVDILSSGIAHFPKDVQLHICLAVSWLNKRQYEQALALLLPFKHIAETHRLIAGCYQALGQMEKAAAIGAGKP